MKKGPQGMYTVMAQERVASNMIKKTRPDTA